MVALRFAALLVLAAMIVFGGALWAPFVLDDHSLAAVPPIGVDGPLMAGMRWTQTRPLTWFTFWLNGRAGSGPAGYHLVDLLFHLGSCLLCWKILRDLLPERAAQIAALLFAIHPLQTEAVVYVYARASLLATLLCLVAWLVWIRGRRWTAVALFALALLAKEEVAAFPLLLLLLQVSQRKPREGWPAILSMLVLSLAAGLRTVAAAAAIPGSGVGAQAGISSFDYFAQQGLALLRYLWLMLVPIGLTIEPQLSADPLLCSLSWGVIAVVLLLAARRFFDANEGFWLIAGFVLLAPSSSFFPAAGLAADRRMYFPLVALAAAAGLVLRRVHPGVLVALGVSFGAVSFAQTRIWQSEQTLWMEAARLAPNRLRPKLQLARLLEPKMAVPLLEDARQMAPNDPHVPAELGRAYLATGQPAKALQEFGRALALAPQDARAMNNRGVAMFALGQVNAAIDDWHRAISTDPCLFDAYLNLNRAAAPALLPPDCLLTAEQRAAIAAQ